MPKLLIPLSLSRMHSAEQLAASNLSTHQKREKNSSGFTLIEVLMATAILGIGLMGVASLIAQASMQDIRAGHVSQGSHLIEQSLENATRAQYSAQAFNALTDTNSSTVIDGVRFSMTCTLSDNTPLERCKEMTCTLSWNNSGSPVSARYVYVLSPKF
jgi:type IV pilus assembly protein PilV